MLFSVYKYLTKIITALVGNQTVRRDLARALILWVKVRLCLIPALYQTSLGTGALWLRLLQPRWGKLQNFKRQVIPHLIMHTPICLAKFLSVFLDTERVVGFSWNAWRVLLSVLFWKSVCRYLKAKGESSLYPWAFLKCLEIFGSCCLGKRNLPLWVVYSSLGHCFVSLVPASLCFPFCLILESAGESMCWLDS